MRKKTKKKKIEFGKFLVPPGEYSSGDRERARDILAALDQGFPELDDDGLLTAYDAASREYHLAKARDYQTAVLSRMVRDHGKDQGLVCFLRLRHNFAASFKQSLTGEAWVRLFRTRPHVLFHEDDRFVDQVRGFTRYFMERLMLDLWDRDKPEDAAALSMVELLADSSFGHYLLEGAVSKSVVASVVKDAEAGRTARPDSRGRRAKARRWAALRRKVLARHSEIREGIGPIIDLVGLERISGVSPFLMLPAVEWVRRRLFPLVRTHCVHPRYAGHILARWVKEVDALSGERVQVFRDGLFWQAVIRAVIGHCLEDGSHHETVYRLLVACVNAPSSVKSLPGVSAQFRKLQGSLAKRVCPLFHGSRDLPVPESRDLAAMAPGQGLAVMAGFMAQALIDKEAYDRLGTLPQKTSALWDMVMGDDPSPLLRALCESLVAGDTPATCYGDFLDHEILALERAERQQWEQDMAAQAGQVAEEAETSLNLPDDTPPPHTWVLVKDAQATTPKTAVVGQEGAAVTACDMQAALHALRKDVPIKPGSVVRAVRHFLREQESGVFTTETVTVNGTKWEKVKRGRVRLLCRLEGDTVLVDVFPRGKWEPGMYE